MGIGDIFKAKENQKLKTQVEELSALLTPEMQDAVNISEHIKELNVKADALDKTIADKETEIKKLEKQIVKMETDKTEKAAELEAKLNQLKTEIVQTENEILLQEFGLYEPVFDFATSDEYKESLKSIREFCKTLIKEGNAVTGDASWTVNGNAAKGKKMVSDMQKLLLRAFNTECDELISKVKYNNYDAYVKRIDKSCSQISKLGAIMGIAITNFYKENKIKELTLAYEYALKKQQEKEEQREIKARMREEAKLQKEIEEARKKLEKEHTHYLNALAKINYQLSEASDTEKAELLKKKIELEEKVGDTEKAIKDVDYREANKRAGYVYIISNIGAFGENIYKIGMTRRLDPMERVDELGDASVPFNFDVHAMIFSDDAPKLENALHKAFESRKVNMVNQRREFFNVTLDEIKKVVKENYDKTVEFIDLPDAEQYRISKKMKADVRSATIEADEALA